MAPAFEPAIAELALSLRVSCARRAAGTVVCWGGGGVIRYGPTPTQVAGLLDAVQITAANEHVCALRRTGEVVCWGRNWAGQLGNGTAGPEHGARDPTQVVGVAGVIAVDAGGAHTCVALGGGSVLCWGSNERGQLGDGTMVDSAIAVEVVGVEDGLGVAAGGGHSCALRERGRVSCWGQNERGQLGDGTTEPSLEPVHVDGLTDATELRATSDFTCALLGDETVACWGRNTPHGYLGNGEGDDRALAVAVRDIDDGQQIDSGLTHACVVRASGRIACWGGNFWNQLGRADLEFSPVPIDVPGIENAHHLATGSEHTCAISAADAVFCWGSNSNGQLGNGSTDPTDGLVRVVGLP